MKRLVLCGVFIALSVGQVQADFFATLSEVKAYAQKYPEYVDSENNDWLNPDFSHFYEKNAAGWLGSLAEKIGMSQSVWLGSIGQRLGVGSSAWNAKSFKALMKKITAARELQGFLGEIIQHEAPQEGDVFVLWCDLFGAFHSLVRDLEYLRTVGVLDNDFKIVKKNYTFVFNGNVIDYSPYILETLTVVLRLMDTNPTQVVYTRGSHEDKQRWQSYGLTQELKMKARNLSNERTPLSKLVTRLFNTLPLALYITQSTANAIDAVLISNNEYADKEINIKAIAGFLDSPGQKGRNVFKLSNTSTTNKSVKIRAIIGGENRTTSYHQTSGLSLLGTKEEASLWMIFSSPTGRNRRLYEFFFDGIVELNVTKQFRDWTLTLYNQDVRSLLGFKEEGTYNLITGQKWDHSGTGMTTAAVVKGDTSTQANEKSSLLSLEPKQNKKELIVASTMDLSKGASPLGKKIKEGLQLRFEEERANEEIKTVIPKLVVIDDEYTPSKTRMAVEHLINDLEIDITIGSQGSASLDSYMDLVKAGKILVMFPYTGAPEFRKPDLRYIINYRRSYVSEGTELTKYALETLRAKKMALFYQNDEFGQGALEGALAVLKEANISKDDYILIPHERNDVNFKQQTQIMKDFSPDTILFLTNAIPIREFIRQMGVQYFAGKKLLGLSVYEDSFEQFLKNQGLEFVLIRMVPDPRTSKLEIVQEYRDWADKNNMSYDKVALETYINASIFLDIIKHLEPPITKEKIIQAAEGIKNYTFKGLTLNFNANKRELGDTLWIDPGTGPWIPKVNREASIQTLPPLDILNAGNSVKTKQVDALDKLKLGSLIDLSKGVRIQGQDVKNGLDARLKQAKDQGDKIPDFIVVDDQYTPDITKKQAEKFVQDGVDILIAPVGSPTLESYLDLVRAKKLLVLFPITGAPIFRKSDLEYMIHFRAPYDVEGQVLTEYAIDKLKSRKVVIFYQDDAFGKGLLDGAQRILKDRNIPDWVLVPYERNSVDFASQVQTIKKVDPDTILFFSTSIAAQELIKQYGIAAMRDKKLLGNSDFGELAFRNFEKENGLHFIYINVVPNPETSDLEIAQQYRTEMKKQNIPLNQFGFEAYIAMDILLMVLHAMQPPYTKEKIVEALANIKDFNYKGIKLSFNRQTRTLANALWIDSGKPEWDLVEIPVPLTQKESDTAPEKNITKDLTTGTLTLGCTVDLSKGLRGFGEQGKIGLEARLKEAQEQGEKVPKLVVLDDEYTPDITKKEVEKLMKEGIDIFIGSSGSATLESYLPLVKDKKILVLFPTTGDPLVRRSDLEYIVHFRAPYDAEGKVLTEYALDTVKPHKVVVLYQNDAFGKGLLSGAQKILKDRNITDWTFVPYERNEVDFAQQVQTIKKIDPDTILFFSTANAAQELIKQYGIDAIREKKLLGSSVLGEREFVSFQKENDLHIVYIQVVPNPEVSDLPIVEQYRAAMKKQNIPLTLLGLETYIGMDILLLALRTMQPPYTKEKVLDALKNIKDYNYKGLKLNFDPHTRSLANILWIDSGTPEWELVEASAK